MSLKGTSNHKIAVKAVYFGKGKSNRSGYETVSKLAVKHAAMLVRMRLRIAVNTVIKYADLSVSYFLAKKFHREMKAKASDNAGSRGNFTYVFILQFIVSIES